VVGAEPAKRDQRADQPRERQHGGGHLHRLEERDPPHLQCADAAVQHQLGEPDQVAREQRRR